MIVETVALCAHVLVFDLSQRCLINVETLLENQWLINQAELLTELPYSCFFF